MDWRFKATDEAGTARAEWDLGSIMQRRILRHGLQLYAVSDSYMALTATFTL